jgi:hypothetical protein
MTVTSPATADVAAGADTTEHSQNRPLPRFCFRYFGSAVVAATRRRCLSTIAKSRASGSALQSSAIPLPASNPASRVFGNVRLRFASDTFASVVTIASASG